METSPSLAKTLMILGTGSNVGKSVLVAGLCRLLLRRGLRVAPFKGQNMALNSAVTADGCEIGRSQAVQAQACRLDPCVEMNPVLLKPVRKVGMQVIVRGNPIGTMNHRDYLKYKVELLPVVIEALETLRSEYDVVLMEGAGSPAEVNLRGLAPDLVNMGMALYAEAPVLLVGDINFGGVFAWLLGTFDLLQEHEQRMVRGFIINKFRGDLNLLESGLQLLESCTGCPVLGVAPYVETLRLPEEDSLDTTPSGGGKLRIDVVRLPHISNFTDFDALRAEPNVTLRFVQRADEIEAPDLLILPGTKNTLGDLQYLVSSGYPAVIERALRDGTEVVGICGGYQMLGERLCDPAGIDGHGGELPGLRLLEIDTVFDSTKSTHQVRASDRQSGIELSAYEIHLGRTSLGPGAAPMFEVHQRGGVAVREMDGAGRPDGRVWGCYLHGLFDTDAYRHHLLQRLWDRRGLPGKAGLAVYDVETQFDSWADCLETSLDMERIFQIIGI